MDNSSCGLYALAYAYTLCEGKIPTNVAYSEVNLRSHLLLSIKSHAVSSFSCGQALYLLGKPKSSKFKIYCSCRLRDAGDEMIKCSKCKEWVNYTCVDLEPGTKIKGSWLCAKYILYILMYIPMYVENCLITMKKIIKFTDCAYLIVLR